MPDLDFTGVDPADYIDATWDDQNGKPWRAHPNGMWYEYVEPVTGGSGAWDDITGKPAAITGTTASFTTALASKLDGIEAGATGDQDLSGLLTISSAASTYAPISTAVTLTGAQTLTNKSISVGQITGLGALATVTPGTNVAAALAIAADATGGIFRQGQALSGTTGTFSGDLSLSGNIGKTSASTLLFTSASGQNIQFSPGAGGLTTIGGSALALTGGSIWGRNSGCSIFLPQAGRIGFGPTGDNFGTNDVALSRKTSTPGVMMLGTGAANSSAGSLELTNLTASGTATAAQYLYTAALFVTESTTARTLTSADHGKTIVCTNAGAVTITLNTGLPTCFFVTIIQKGAGQVTVSGSATLEVFTGFAAKTAGQHAQMSVSNYGTSNVYHVAGQLGT